MEEEVRRSPALQALFDKVAAVRGVNIATLVHWPTDRKQWDESLLHRQIAWAKRAGFNTVKLPINWNPFMGPEPSHEIAGDFLDVVARAVDEVRSHGLLAIIDHHKAAYAPHDPNGSHNRVFAVWRQVGQRFAGIPDHELWFQPFADYTHNIYGTVSAQAFDLNSEDVDGHSFEAYSTAVDQLRADHADLMMAGRLSEAASLLRPDSTLTKESNEALSTVTPRALAIIREKNPTRPVLLRNLTKAHACLSPWIINPEEDDALIDYIHTYHPSVFCQQGSAMFAPSDRGARYYTMTSGVRWRGTNSERRAVRSVLRAYLVRGNLRERPVLVVEFGCVRAARTRDRMAHIACAREEFERAGLGYIYWEAFENFGFADPRTQRVWDPGALAALLPDSPLLPLKRLMPAAVAVASLRSCVLRTFRRARARIKKK